MAAGSANFH